MNVEQLFLNQLYQTVVYQEKRCQRLAGSHNEKRVLEMVRDEYFNYYIDKTNEIQQQLAVRREAAVGSFFTYDPKYQAEMYEGLKCEVEAYVTALPTKDLHANLTSISPTIDAMFPGLMLKPTLLAQFEKKNQTTSAQKILPVLDLTRSTTLTCV
jgi:hypothetical protein